MNPTLAQNLSPLFSLAKAIIFGVVCSLGALVLLVIVKFGSASWIGPKPAGLGATAGGWTQLLREPTTALLLAFAYGIGFWIIARK
jgi:hypothetical protein